MRESVREEVPFFHFSTYLEEKCFHFWPWLLPQWDPWFHEETEALSTQAWLCSCWLLSSLPWREEEKQYGNSWCQQSISTYCLHILYSHLHIYFHCFLVEGNVNKLHPKVVCCFVKGCVDTHWSKTAEIRVKIMFVRTRLETRQCLIFTFATLAWTWLRIVLPKEKKDKKEVRH